MGMSPAMVLRGPGHVFALAWDVIKLTFTTRFQFREFVEQAWFVASVTMMPTILVSIPFGAVIALQVGNLTGQLGAESFAGATAVLATVREAAPIAAALIIAGAAGSAPPKAAPAPVLEVPVTADASGRPPFYKNLTLVLATLVALAAVGVGALWWQAERESASTTANGVLVGEDARTEVVISAADLATRTLSYDYKNFENDLETARARMTKTFRKEYDATMSQIKANTEKNKIVLQATAVSSAIISATEHRAKVLVFLNQTTTAGVGKSAKQQASQNSLVVTLTRGDGDWAISKLTALG